MLNFRKKNILFIVVLPSLILGGCSNDKPAPPAPGCTQEMNLEIGNGVTSPFIKINTKNSCLTAPEQNTSFFNRIGSLVLAYSNFSLNDVDFSGYEVQITTSNAILANKPGNFKVELFDGNTLIAQQYFSYTLINNKLKLANPTQVKNWALSYEGIATRFDISVGDIEGTPGEGEGSITLKTNYKNNVISTQTSHFSNSSAKCSGREYECEVDEL